jgi:Bifunctional DNA primase/polymerase, N-terminal
MIPDELRRLHEQGRSLIPVGADKKCLVAWKPYQTGRADLGQVEAWHVQLSPAIWAVVTGEVSGVVSLDFDMPHGPSTLAALGLPAHRSTPSGGAHTDVVHPGWRVSTVSSKIKKDLAEKYPGLDVRGDGGYINVLGRTAIGSYRWLTDEPPLSVEMLPDDLRAALGLVAPPPAAASAVLIPTPRPPLDRKPALVGAVGMPAAQLLDVALRKAPVEGRNNAGFWLACQLRDQGLILDDAQTEMQTFTSEVAVTNSKGAYEPYELDEALASLNQAYRALPRDSWHRPGEIIVSDKQLRDLTNEAVTALVKQNDPPTVFMRGGALTRLVRDEQGTVRPEVLRPDSVRHLLSQIADWMRPGQGGVLINVHPPMAVARDWLAREWAELPRLTGILTAPCLRPDGSLLDQPGHDLTTGLWLDPDGLTIPRVPEHPTDEEIATARLLLEGELLGDFPFVDDASRANALALVLTPVLRPAISGLVPLALVDAPVAGTGKTFLVNLAAILGTGQQARLTAAPAHDGDEELRKRLTSILMAGEAMIVFDNVSTTLSSSVLAQALTASVWSDRILNVSTMINVQPQVTWAATGNNITLGGDLARRCYPIRLDPRTAQPWEREFRRPDLEEWAMAERGRLLAAALTLARAWYDRGCPTCRVPRLGGFQRWTTMMSGILTTAGVAGFLDNLSELTETSDVETAGWLSLLRRWHEQFQNMPVTTAQVGALLKAADGQLDLPPTLANSLGSAPDDTTRNVRLARKIGTILGRRFDDSGLRIERAEIDGHTKAVRWRAVTER